MMKTTYSGLLLVILVAINAPSCLAQEEVDRHPLLEDKFTAALGAYIFDKDVGLRVDGSVPGEEIDFDDRVGLKSDDTSIAGSFNWNFGEKWSLAGQFFDTSDKTTAILTEDVTWGDDTLKAGTNVGAGIGLSVARIFVGRKFSEGPNHQFGLGLGLHWLELDAFISGEVFVNDESTGFKVDAVNAEAPLPNIGGWYKYAFSPKWLIDARLDWLDASIGDYSGSLWNTSVGIQYQAFKHVGFLLSYQLFKLDIDVDKSDWRGGVDLQYDGPFLAITGNW